MDLCFFASNEAQAKHGQIKTGVEPSHTFRNEGTELGPSHLVLHSSEFVVRLDPHDSQIE